MDGGGGVTLAMSAAMSAARAAALAAVVAASGVVAVAAGATSAAHHPATQQSAALRLSYTCHSPAGTGQAAARLAATLPATGVAGKPLQPTGVTLTLTLPRTVLSYLAKRGVTAVTATDRLTLAVAGAGQRAGRVGWPGTVPSTKVPASGGLTLTASGRVPALTTGERGRLTLAAGQVAVVLAPQAATIQPGTRQGPAASPSPSPSPSPSAANPAATTLGVTCTPGRGQPVALATIPVTAGPPGRKSPTAASAKHFCPPQPKGGLKLNPKFPIPKPPKGSQTIKPPPEPGCAFIVGYSNVEKLNGAALVGPGLSNLAVAVKEFVKQPNYFQEDSAAELEFKPCPTCKIQHALPPSRATFLAFGFMPVSATMQLTEIGNINIISIGGGFSLTSNTVWSEVSLRIHDVKVNGVPLPVGPHCGASKPILLKLSGDPKGHPPYALQTGGPLTGNITIPKFTGCGVGQNLNPIFNASIAGPKNFVLLTQGPPCFITGGGFGCPPKQPKPIH
jgi:hypothetical protein